MKEQFQIHSSIEEYQRSHNCCSCTIADTKQSSGDSGCSIVLLSFFLRSSVDKHPMPSNSFEIVVAPGIYSFCVHRHENNNFWQNLKLPVFQLLIIFSFWWSSEPLMTSASGRQLLMRMLLMRVFLMMSTSGDLQNLFSSDAFLQLKLPFCRFTCSHLFFITYALFKDTQIFVYGPAHLNKY